MTNELWGIDLGGTKMEGIVLESIENPRILARHRADTEAHLGSEAVLRNIAALVARLSGDLGGRKPSSIGFAHPGVVDPKTSLLKNCNARCLEGTPFKSDLESILKTTIHTANDANCFALAEALLGAGKGAPCVFGVIMGTGVGGGLVFEGKARYGCQGIAGEWGHNVLDPSGDSCYCGKSGCVEQFISGTALQRFYEGLSGTRRSMAEIVERHDSGEDSAATATIERLVDYFGRAISVLINILDPEVIVLGGGVSNVDILYTAGIEAVKANVFNDTLETRIVRNKLGDSAGMYGAAMLNIAGE